MAPSLGMAEGGVQYADHEVQIITNQISMNGEGNVSDAVTMLDQLQPVSNRGLDNDELAELVAMYRVHYIDIDRNQEERQSQQGSLDSESALGINLSQADLPSQANNRNPTSADREIIEDTGDVVNVNRGANYTEPGSLDFVRTQVTAPGRDATTDEATAGASGQPVNNERFINFRSEFGSGPYVDSTDDITVFLEVALNNLVSAPSIESTYQLYWNIEEMPEGRSSFRRP